MSEEAAKVAVAELYDKAKFLLDLHNCDFIRKIENIGQLTKRGYPDSYDSLASFLLHYHHLLELNNKTKGFLELVKEKGAYLPDSLEAALDVVGAEVSDKKTKGLARIYQLKIDSYKSSLNKIIENLPKTEEDVRTKAKELLPKIVAELGIGDMLGEGYIIKNIPPDCNLRLESKESVNGVTFEFSANHYYSKNQTGIDYIVLMKCYWDEKEQLKPKLFVTKAIIECQYKELGEVDTNFYNNCIRYSTKNLDSAREVMKITTERLKELDGLQEFSEAVELYDKGLAQEQMDVQTQIYLKNIGSDIFEEAAKEFETKHSRYLELITKIQKKFFAEKAA
jgi:hypothetical protein